MNSENQKFKMGLTKLKPSVVRAVLFSGGSSGGSISFPFSAFRGYCTVLGLWPLPSSKPVVIGQIFLMSPLSNSDSSASLF